MLLFMSTSLLTLPLYSPIKQFKRDRFEGLLGRLWLVPYNPFLTIEKAKLGIIDMRGKFRISRQKPLRLNETYLFHRPQLHKARSSHLTPFAV